MLILNTGGTFNKRYNPISGELEVPYDNDAVEHATRYFGYELNIAGAIYKDSLDMTVDDRKMLADIINASDEEVVIVVHGTDTMELSAAFVAEAVPEKAVIFTGAMIPFSIEPVDATANLAMALGYAACRPVPGAYIVMQGLIAPHDRIRKNKALGRFEIV
jgi:L-asparaginase